MGLGDGLRVRGRKCENEDEERHVREPEQSERLITA
jgi:hypothetical protein